MTNEVVAVVAAIAGARRSVDHQRKVAVFSPVDFTVRDTGDPAEVPIARAPLEHDQADSEEQAAAGNKEHLGSKKVPHPLIYRRPQPPPLVV